VQAAKAGDEVQHLVQHLARYFLVEDIVAATGYSKVKCVLLLAFWWPLEIGGLCRLGARGST